VPFPGEHPWAYTLAIPWSAMRKEPHSRKGPRRSLCGLGVPRRPGSTRHPIRTKLTGSHGGRSTRTGLLVLLIPRLDDPARSGLATRPVANTTRKQGWLAFPGRLAVGRRSDAVPACGGLSLPDQGGGLTRPGGHVSVHGQLGSGVARRADGPSQRTRRAGPAGRGGAGSPTPTTARLWRRCGTSACCRSGRTAVSRGCVNARFAHIRPVPRVRPVVFCREMARR
jgi:hypothetical protein